MYAMQVSINGFSEQDQENLYNATQAGKSAGKKGLGKSTHVGTIGGAKWEGKKTILGDEDEADAAAVALETSEPLKPSAEAQGAASASFFEMCQS